MDQIRILAAEDDADFQYLLQKSFAPYPDLSLTGFFEDGEAACRAAVAEEPDIVLMDLALADGRMEGAAAARRIRLATRAKVILLTSYEQPETVIRASTEAFASAYVMKSQFPLLVPTIRETAQGVTPQAHLICSVLLNRLTAAELAVFHHMMGHMVDLQSSGKTIANQKTTVLHKLDLRNKQQLRHVFSAYFPPAPEGTA